jgi:hypothetical protein
MFEDPIVFYFNLCGLDEEARQICYELFCHGKQPADAVALLKSDTKLTGLLWVAFELFERAAEFFYEDDEDDDDESVSPVVSISQPELVAA